MGVVECGELGVLVCLQLIYVESPSGYGELYCCLNGLYI